MSTASTVRLVLVVLGAALLALPVQAANLVQNGTFDIDVSGWVVVVPGSSTLVWDPLDADGSPSSGSALATNTAAVASGSVFFDQCVPGLSAGQGYELVTEILFPGGQTTTGRAEVVLYWYAGAGCTSSPLGGGGTPFVFSSTPDTWLLSRSAGLFGPVGVHSAIVRLYLTKIEASGALAVHYDNVLFGPDANAIFGDDFESGGTSGWSAVVP